VNEISTGVAMPPNDATKHRIGHIGTKFYLWAVLGVREIDITNVYVQKQ